MGSTDLPKEGSMRSGQGDAPESKRRTMWWDRPVNTQTVAVVGAILCFGSALLDYRRVGYSNYAQLMLLGGIYFLFLLWMSGRKKG